MGEDKNVWAIVKDKERLRERTFYEFKSDKNKESQIYADNLLFYLFLHFKMIAMSYNYGFFFF